MPVRRVPVTALSVERSCRIALRYFVRAEGELKPFPTHHALAACPAARDGAPEAAAERQVT